jgi:hypothetical protein
MQEHRNAAFSEIVFAETLLNRVDGIHHCLEEREQGVFDVGG